MPDSPIRLLPDALPLSDGDFFVLDQALPPTAKASLADVRDAVQRLGDSVDVLASGSYQAGLFAEVFNIIPAVPSEFPTYAGIVGTTLDLPTRMRVTVTVHGTLFFTSVIGGTPAGVGTYFFTDGVAWPTAFDVPGVDVGASFIDLDTGWPMSWTWTQDLDAGTHDFVWSGWRAVGSVPCTVIWSKMTAAADALLVFSTGHALASVLRRVTEAGDYRITEGGDYRVLE